MKLLGLRCCRQPREAKHPNNQQEPICTDIVDNICECFDDDEKVESFRATKDGLAALEAAMNNGGGGGRRNRNLQQQEHAHRELAAGALFAGAKILAGTVTKGAGAAAKGGKGLSNVAGVIGSVLGLADFGLSIFGEVENTDQQILDRWHKRYPR